MTNFDETAKDWDSDLNRTGACPSGDAVLLMLMSRLVIAREETWRKIQRSV